MSCSVCQGYSSHNCPCCREDVRMIICPDCNGTGKGNWKVWDIYERKEVECTEIAYLTAPEDEDVAHYLGKRYCRLSSICLTCKGEGEIPEDY